MDLENSVKDCISKELEKGIIEKVIAEKLEKCISSSIEDLFSWNGCIKKTVEEKLKETMTPYLENYDYSKCITKLDTVLTEVLKLTALDNKKMLENFKELMVSNIPDKINITDIYKKWCNYCEKEIDKDKIDNYDYEGGYINTNLRVEEVSNGWSDYEKNVVTFECEEDEDLNIEFILTRWKKYDKESTLIWDKPSDLKSLRYLNEFDMFMMNLNQAYSKINIDKEYEANEIFIEYEE